MPRPFLTALAVLALTGGGVIAGCGDDKKSDSAAGSSTAAPAPAQTGATPATSGTPSGETVMVSMKQIKFIPEKVTAKVGQKILWTNNDGQIPHTVTATKGATFDSGNIAEGETFDYTPTKAGVIDYVCTIHSGQTGQISVTK
jgi:plastocyanin